MSEPRHLDLIDRLRGKYHLPVNDGAGPLNGSMTFSREYPTPPIQKEAAAEIERLRQGAREEVARWMIERGYATGHGDTVEDLLREMVGDVLARRPVAFRVSNGRGGWIVTQDEQEARDIAEIAGCDYDGLYMRRVVASGDRKPEPPTTPRA